MGWSFRPLPLPEDDDDDDDDGAAAAAGAVATDTDTAAAAAVVVVVVILLFAICVQMRGLPTTIFLCSAHKICKWPIGRSLSLHQSLWPQRPYVTHLA